MMENMALDPGDNVRPMAANDVTVVRQHFERGEMFWFAPGESEANGFIFVLMDTDQWTDQWWRGEDTWDGLTRPSAVAPPGLLVPSGGFGHVWAVEDFEDELGFAVSREYVADDGYYTARGDGWELHIGDRMIDLLADRQWIPPSPEPEPDPMPEPEPEPTPAELDYGWWVWLAELNMPVNLDHVVWIGADRLRIGSHDIVLTLPEATATALRAYVKTRCVEII